MKNLITSSPLHAEYHLARMKYYQALHNFDNANPEYVDAAIAELKAAETKMDAILRELKQEKGVAI